MNSKTKIIVTIGAGILLTMAAIFFGFKPILASVKALNVTLAGKQAELNKIQRQIVEFKSAQSDLARATFKEDVYGTVVIREDLDQAIVDLEAAAEKTGTTESISIFEETQQKSAKKGAVQPVEVFSGLALSQEVRYNIAVSNDFVGLVEFVQYMEHLPHFTEFDKITLNAISEQISLDRGGGVRNTGGVTGTMEGVFLVKKTNAKTTNEDK